jgi:signal transduction histidine kinase
MNRTRTIAWASFAVFVVGLAVGLAFDVVNRTTNTTASQSASWSNGGLVTVLVQLPLLAFPIVGLLIALRRPENTIGWVMLGIGVSIGPPLQGYATYALLTHPGSLPGGALVAAINEPTWVPLIGLSGIFLILLFPDGHLPSPRWRWFARIAGAGLVVSAIAILTSPGTIDSFPQTPNPLAVPALELLQISILTVPLGIVGAAVSLVLRYRRSAGVERLQLKWLAAAASIVAAVYIVTFPLTLLIETRTGDTPTWLGLLQDLALLTFGLIPIAIGISVLKYRLYEIDVVINKTVLFATLAIFITAVYMAIVVGVGAAVGDRGSPILSAAAAAVVAIAFQPLRRRAQHLADRVVYGRRATPYEVLSEFSDRLSGTYAQEDLLPRMATILAEGAGAVRADVWLREADELRPLATWPAEAERLDAVPADPMPEGMIPVRHQGELLGALSIVKQPGESMGATELKLVTDLAAQAGLVLRNARLSSELLRRLDELKASRQRLVAAQDQERRKLERNIHDGAQQQLVALAVKLRLAQQFVDRDAERAKALLEDLQTATAQALDDLRDLARGIYPPLLADKGLPAALQAQATRASLPVRVEPDGIGRYQADVEATVYFCVLEALNNVAKYAGASSARVRLDATDGWLSFDVTDDGRGFDPRDHAYGTGLQGMEDRLAALEGVLEVRSRPGGGTTVVGRVPVKEALP